MAKGRQLSEIYSAVRDGELRLRGSLQRLTQHGNDEPIGFEADVEADDSFHLALELAVDESGLAIHRETLHTDDTEIYSAVTSETEDLVVNLSAIAFPPFRWIQETPVFVHAPGFPWPMPRGSQLARLAFHLSRFAVFHPIPDEMRGYVSTADTNLRPNGANLSAALRQLCEHGQKDQILEFVRALPEQNICDIDFVEVPSRDDVMLKLQESFGHEKHWQDASVLSDGTLRALAVVTAVSSCESLLIIEDIDDGVHPSRLGHMLELVRAHAEQRGIRVLVTTHNPALLDALPASELRHVVACYRDPEHGDSRLIELGDLNEFPALAARGPLGQLLTRGIVDHALKHDRTDEQRAADAREWLAELEAGR